MDEKNMFDAVKLAAEQYADAAWGDKSFPDAAFIVEKGAETDTNGNTLQKYRHLPHHKKTVKSPTENGSVDLPHLRNALARVSQVQPVKESAAGFKSRAKSHLLRHAKALLKTYKAEVTAMVQEFGLDLNDIKEEE